MGLTKLVFVCRQCRKELRSMSYSDNLLQRLLNVVPAKFSIKFSIT